MINQNILCTHTRWSWSMRLFGVKGNAVRWMRLCEFAFPLTYTYRCVGEQINVLCYEINQSAELFTNSLYASHLMLLLTTFCPLNFLEHRVIHQRIISKSSYNFLFCCFVLLSSQFNAVLWLLSHTDIKSIMPNIELP